jgi:chromosome segregation ATPase
MRLPAIAFATAALLLAAGAASGADDVEARLRQALRAATTQQRALEDEVATLRAKQSKSDRQVQELTATSADQTKTIDQLHKEATELAAATGKLRDQATELAQKLKASEQGLAETQASLTKWKAAYNEAADVARSRDADAKLLQTQLGQTTQRADTCEAKNGELFKLGNEILKLYEGKGPLTALFEREPVTQIKRVELENLVQDYHSKLLDSRVSSRQR